MLPPPRVADLAARIARLEDTEAIRNLIAAYGPLADRGDAAGVAALWTADGEYDVGGFGIASGREAIAGLIESATHRDLVACGCAHVLSPHHVALNGDTAVAIGYSTVYRLVEGTPDPWRVSANKWHLERQQDGRWLVIRRVNRPIDARKTLYRTARHHPRPNPAMTSQNRPAVLSRLWANAYILLTSTALFWAGNAVVGRAVRDVFPPIGLAFWRWTIALVLILPFALPHLKRDRAALLGAWPVMVLLGTLGIGAFNSMLYTGLTQTSALNAMLLQSAQPGLILLVGAIVMGDRTTMRQIAGAVIAMLGVLAIIARGEPAKLLALRLNWGDLVIALAVFLWAIYSVFLRRKPAVHPLSFFAATLMVGSVVIAPFYLWELAHGERIVAVPESWAALAYVALFPSILAYLFFNRAVELIGSASTGIYMNVTPVLGAGLAVLFLSETIRLFHLGGLAFILSGVLLAGRGPRPAVAGGAP